MYMYDITPTSGVSHNYRYVAGEYREWAEGVRASPTKFINIKELRYSKVSILAIMFIGQLMLMAALLRNKCTNYLHIILNFINFDLNIFGLVPVISTTSAPDHVYSYF